MAWQHKAQAALPRRSSAAGRCRASAGPAARRAHVVARRRAPRGLEVAIRRVAANEPADRRASSIKAVLWRVQAERLCARAAASGGAARGRSGGRRPAARLRHRAGRAAPARAPAAGCPGSIRWRRPRTRSPAGHAARAKAAPAAGPPRHHGAPQRQSCTSTGSSGGMMSGSRSVMVAPYRHRRRSLSTNAPAALREPQMYLCHRRCTLLNCDTSGLRSSWRATGSFLRAVLRQDGTRDY